MKFQSAPPSVVKAIRQRDLLNTWLRLYSRKQAVPAVTNYEPSRLKEELDDLVYYSVSATQSPPLLTIQSEGTRMSNAYGRSGKGVQLDQYVGAILAPFVLPPYYESVARKLPIYTIDEMEDAAGHQIQYERLLLPFGTDDLITHIVASLKTISIDGGFEIRNLMRRTDARPRAVLRTVIDQDLFHHLPHRSAPAISDLEFD